MRNPKKKSGYFRRCLTQFLWILFSVTPAIAVELPQEVCLISTADPEFRKLRESMFQYVAANYADTPNFGAYCSGVVTGDHTVTSAAHCFFPREEFELMLECPGKEPRPIDYRFVTQNKESGDDNDLATVTFREPLDVEPIIMVSSEDELQELIALNQCYLAGYPGSTFGQMKILPVDMQVGTRHFISSASYKEMVMHGVMEMDDAIRMNEVAKIVYPDREPPPIPVADDVYRKFIAAKDLAPADAERIVLFGHKDKSEHGTSGGALYCHDSLGGRILIGIHTEGPGRDGDTEIVSQNVLHHRGWILRNSYQPASRAGTNSAPSKGERRQSRAE